MNMIAACLRVLLLIVPFHMSGVSCAISRWFDLMHGDSPVDLVVLMDRSYGVSAKTFLLIEKKLVADLLRNHVEIGPGLSHVTVITFAITATEIFPGNATSGQDMNKCRLFESGLWDNYVRYIPEGTESLGTFIDNAYTTALGVFSRRSRPGSKRVLLVISDGSFDNSRSPTTQKSWLEQQYQVEIFTVGIGFWIEENSWKVQLLASQSSNYAYYMNWLDESRRQQNIGKFKSKTTVLNNFLTCSHGTSYCNNLAGYSECLCNNGVNLQACTQGEATMTTCNGNPCHHQEMGARCEQGIDTAYCLCPWGYTGKYCQVEEKECSQGACANNGRCIDQTNAYTCDCSNTAFCGDTCLDFGASNCGGVPDTTFPPFPNTPTTTTVRNPITTQRPVTRYVTPTTTDRTPGGSSSKSSGDGLDYISILIIVSPCIVLLVILVAAAAYCFNNWDSVKKKMEDIYGTHVKRGPPPDTGPILAYGMEYAMTIQKDGHTNGRIQSNPSPVSTRNYLHSTTLDPSMLPDYTRKPMAAVIPQQMPPPSPTRNYPTMPIPNKPPHTPLQPLEVSYIPPSLSQSSLSSGPPSPNLYQHPLPPPLPPLSSLPPPPPPLPSENDDIYGYHGPLRQPSAAPQRPYVEKHYGDEIYEKLPLHKHMSEWLQYVCETMAEEKIDKLCIIRLDCESYITTTMKFKFEKNEIEELRSHMINRSEYDIKVKNRMYSVIDNNGYTLMLRTRDSRRFMGVGTSRQYLVVATMNLEDEVELLRYEVQWIAKHLVSDGV